jgi:hypothetical protein
MRMRTFADFLLCCLIVACSTTSSLVAKSHLDNLDCGDPKGYSVEEDPETNSLKIVSDGNVFHTIKLFTDEERNGFAFNGAKKTKDGFEMSIEYGSVIYYAKTFTFICRQHKLYLTKIRVESFNKHNPEKWSRKVVRVQPKVPLEKFSITDFMLEGVVKE